MNWSLITRVQIVEQPTMHQQWLRKTGSQFTPGIGSHSSVLWCWTVSPPFYPSHRLPQQCTLLLDSQSCLLPQASAPTAVYFAIGQSILPSTPGIGSHSGVLCCWTVSPAFNPRHRLPQQCTLLLDSQSCWQRTIAIRSSSSLNWNCSRIVRAQTRNI